MNKRIGEFLLPAYLLASILLGGSSQSIWGLAALELGGVMIIAWAIVRPARKLHGAERTLLFFSILLVALFLVQLVPLPPPLWTKLPGRDLLAGGYRTLGQSLPWLPLTMAPYATLATLLTLLPPLAVIVAVPNLRADDERWCVAAILAGTLAAILLGFIQITSGNLPTTHWYLYPQTNVGSAVGFFANRNHMGTLLLVAAAFVPALCFNSADQSRTQAVPLRIMGISMLLVLLLGIAMNGSLAAVLLSVPVLVASAATMPALGRVRGLLGTLAALTLIGATIFLAASPVQPKITGKSTESIEGRRDIWKQSVALAKDTFPVGSGLGTFEQIYATTEDSQTIGPAYVNHAHNDFLEIAVEGGLPAILLAGAFLVWWLRGAWGSFSSASSLASAAAIASGAILAHSMVDYPLRTSAIASLFAFAVATIARPPRKEPEEHRISDRASAVPL